MLDNDQVRLLAVIKAAVEGGQPQADAVLPEGQTLRVIDNPEPGVAKRITVVGGDGADPGEVIEGTLWEAAMERPAGYPADVPFVPHAAVSVTPIPGRDAVTLSWDKVDDIPPIVDQLISENEAAGWVRSEAPALPSELGMQMLPFTRGGRQRLIIAVELAALRRVTMIEAPAGD